MIPWWKQTVLTRSVVRSANNTSGNVLLGEYIDGDMTLTVKLQTQLIADPALGFKKTVNSIFTRDYVKFLGDLYNINTDGRELKLTLAPDLDFLLKIGKYARKILRDKPRQLTFPVNDEWPMRRGLSGLKGVNDTGRRMTNTEIELLYHLHTHISTDPFSKPKLILYSTLDVCDTCFYSLLLFQHHHPALSVEAISWNQYQDAHIWATKRGHSEVDQERRTFNFQSLFQ